MRNRQVDRDLRIIETSDPDQTTQLRWTFAHRRPPVPRQQQRRVLYRLVQLLTAHPHEELRWWAAYTLNAAPCGGADARPAMLRAALNDDSIRVRAQALEGVGCMNQYRSGPMVERTAAALPGLLADAAPEIRFWALYAVGQMGRTELRDAVSSRVGDPHVVDGLWSVGEEAEDVLIVLDGGAWPDRAPVGLPGRGPSSTG